MQPNEAQPEPIAEQPPEGAIPQAAAPVIPPPAQAPGIDYTALAAAFRAHHNMENATAVPTVQSEQNRLLALSTQIV